MSAEVRGSVRIKNEQKARELNETYDILKMPAGLMQKGHVTSVYDIV